MYAEEIGIGYESIEGLKKVELDKKVKEWDTKKWEEDVKCKTTLSIYREWKKEIEEEKIYDNKPSSIIWYRARSGSLNINGKKKYTGKAEDLKCPMCAQIEDMEHFLLHCQGTMKEREKIRELQRSFKISKKL